MPLELVRVPPLGNLAKMAESYILQVVTPMDIPLQLWPIQEMAVVAVALSQAREIQQLQQQRALQES